jgi:MoxR-like ATPase
LLGQNVLLTGPTGTGKTVLAVQAVKTIATKLHIGLETIKGKSLALELQNNPDAYNILDQFVVVLSGHAGITPSEFIAKMGLKGDEKGGTQTYTQLGKVLKAFVDGNIPIIDEIDLIPNDVLMRIKHLFTLKPGKMYAPQEDGNQTHKLLTTTVIATANIKSAKHADRQEMDPAIVRLLPGTEVKYLPKEETYDLALANIIEPK